MAGSLSSLPALDINPVGFGAENSTQISNSQISYLNAQKAQALQPLEVEEAQQAIPLEMKAKQQQSQLATMAYGRNLVADTIQDVKAAEAAGQSTADIANIWDAGMQRAKEAGYDAAGQYIGHYQPGLSERLGDVYGPQAAQARESAAAQKAAAVDQTQIDRAVSAMPEPQLRKAAANQQLVINGWNRIQTGGKAAWDEEMANFKAAGIDPIKDGHLTSLEFTPLNYATAARKIQELQPIFDSMQRRLDLLNTGGPSIQPAPIGQSTLVGTDPATGRPIYHNPITNQDTVGPYAMGPKPTAATATFQTKYQMALRGGMSAPDALQFANGRKDLPDARLRDMAKNEALRQYGDMVQNGSADNIKDVNGWVDKQTAQNYGILKSSAGGGTGGGGTTAAIQPPPRALEFLKRSPNVPQRFPNGQVWVWRNGQAVRVQ